MQYFKIGKLVATRGLKGELVLQHSLGKKTALKNLKTIFVAQKSGDFLPYFIAGAAAKSETETIMMLEGIDSKEAGAKVISKEVWLEENDFKKFAAKAAPISLLGYAIIDGERNLGEIIEVFEQPHQVLCTIIYRGKEALIPVHENNLLKMDEKKREIHVDLPEGLLELYSNES